MIKNPIENQTTGISRQISLVQYPNIPYGPIPQSHNAWNGLVNDFLLVKAGQNTALWLAEIHATSNVYRRSRSRSGDNRAISFFPKVLFEGYRVVKRIMEATPLDRIAWEREIAPI